MKLKAVHKRASQWPVRMLHPPTYIATYNHTDLLLAGAFTPYDTHEINKHYVRV